MKRRWFIRCLFMLPILLCMGGWGWSGWYHGWIAWAGSFSVVCGTHWGCVYMHCSESHSNGWLWGASGGGSYYRFWPTDTPVIFSFIGFRFFTVGTYGYGLIVPYWFLIVVFSAVLLLIWRKTRPAKPGRAFPVELAPDARPLLVNG